MVTLLQACTGCGSAGHFWAGQLHLCHCAWAVWRRWPRLASAEPSCKFAAFPLLTTSLLSIVHFEPSCKMCCMWWQSAQHSRLHRKCIWEKTALTHADCTWKTLPHSLSPDKEPQDWNVRPQAACNLLCVMTVRAKKAVQAIAYKDSIKRHDSLIDTRITTLMAKSSSLGSSHCLTRFKATCIPAAPVWELHVSNMLGG